MGYKDPAPFIVEYLTNFFQDSDVQVFGSTIPADTMGTCVSVKNAGGSPYAARPYTRLMLLGRADVDYIAHDAVNAATNELEHYGYQVQGVKVTRIRPDGRPVDSIDEDTKQPEAWVYIIVEHLEA